MRQCRQREGARDRRSAGAAVRASKGKSKKCDKTSRRPSLVDRKQKMAVPRDVSDAFRRDVAPFFSFRGPHTPTMIERWRESISEKGSAHSTWRTTAKPSWSTAPLIGSRMIRRFSTTSPSRTELPRSRETKWASVLIQCVRCFQPPFPSDFSRYSASFPDCGGHDGESWLDPHRPERLVDGGL